MTDVPARPNIFSAAETPHSVIFQLAGAASTCWENLEGAGVFKDQFAVRACEDAIARLAEFGIEIKER